MRSGILTVLLAAIVLPSGLYAQNRPLSPTGVQGRHRGILHDAIEREAVLAAGAQAGPSPPDVPHASWRARHQVAFGAIVGSVYPLVGTGIGACAGHFASAKQKKYDAPSSAGPDVRSVGHLVAVLRGRQITVTTITGDQVKGVVGGVTAIEFGVTPEGQIGSVPIAYTNVRSIRGRPTSAKAKAGIAACIIAPVAAFGWAAWALSGS